MAEAIGGSRAMIEELNPSGSHVSGLNQGLDRQLGNAKEAVTIGASYDEALGFSKDASKIPGAHHMEVSGIHSGVLQNPTTHKLVDKALRGEELPTGRVDNKAFDRVGRGLGAFDIGSGAIQFGNGVSQLAQGNIVNGALDTVGGGSTAVSGSSMLAGAARMARLTGAGGAVADGVYGMVNANNTHDRIVSGLKTAAGVGMAFNPLVGSLAYGGLLAHENFDQISAFAGNAFNRMASFF